MTTTTPLLIAVAPNGARRTQADHSTLPLTPGELAETAVQCCEAGAAMIHLHVRDRADLHTLDPATYRLAIKEVEQAVGDRMLIQVTSEAAGVYQAAQQMAAMRELAPKCVSIGLREIISDDEDKDAGARFLAELSAHGTLIQYILYSVKDIRWYQQLCSESVIPRQDNMVLLVIGRYSEPEFQAEPLAEYLNTLSHTEQWMVCAFGKKEPNVMRHAIRHGGHCRVGFENNLWLPDGSVAENNAALITVTASAAKESGRTLITDGVSAAQLFGGV